MIFPGSDMPDHSVAQKRAKAEAYKAWADGERERARRQRTYLTALSGTVRDALVRSMLNRAWELLDSNEAEACDALLEFVPAADADALLEEYFKEDFAPAPRTRMRRVGDLSEPYVAPPSIVRWQNRRAERSRARA